MSVVVLAGRLREEMARRGWAATELAQASGLSNATVSAAIAGRAISASSLMLIAKALSRIPPDHVIDSLIFGTTPQRDVE